MNIGVQFLREHMPKTCSVHYAFSDTGGRSPNVVQPTSKLVYMVRASNVRSAKALLNRVDKIAQGAALMTETTMTSRQIDGTSSTLSNGVLEKLLYENLCQAPLPMYTEEEIAFAKALRATFPAQKLPGQRTDEDFTLRSFVSEHSCNGAKALNDFILPYVPSLHMNPGSTDVGDVSWLTPTAQFTAVTWPSCAPGHSWQIVSMGKTTIAHKGLLLAAKVLAGTAADLLEDITILDNARQEFAHAAAEGYDCPITADVAPQ